MEYPLRSKLITSLYSAFICSSLFSKRLEHLGDALLLLFHVRVNIEVKGCCNIGMTEQYAYGLVVAVAFNAACRKVVMRSVPFNQVKQELNATSKNVQDKLHAMDNTPLKKVVTHRFEPTSKYVLLFIGGLALSLVISIWGNLAQWREYQAWEVADLKYRALKMVLPSDDPNVRYIEKHFSVCRDEKVIDDVRNRVAAYEDSIRHHHEMVEMATYKDSIANKLLQESNRIKRAMKSSK